MKKVAFWIFLTWFASMASGSLDASSSSKILSRHRRLVRASSTGWTVAFNFDATIPITTCFDELVALLSNNKTEETEPCITRPLMLRLPNFQYQVDTETVVDTHVNFLWIGSDLPFDLGRYNASFFAPTPLGFNKTEYTGNFRFYSQPDQKVRWFLSYEVPFIFLENKTARAVDLIEEWYDPNVISDLLINSDWDINEISSRSVRSIQEKPQLLSHDILRREQERLKMVAKLEATLEKLDNGYWRSAIDEDGDSYFENFGDVKSCLLRFLCETTLRQSRNHRYDSKDSFLIEIANLLVTPIHVLPRLPKVFGEDEYIEAQFEAFRKGNCEAYELYCKKSIFTEVGFFLHSCHIKSALF